MKKPYATLQSHQGEPVASHRAYPYHCVAIRYYDNTACPAVKQLAVQPTALTQTPPSLETRRFLSGEAPLLPLADCTKKICQCCYVHYADRRQRDRRHAHGQPLPSTPVFIGQERRSGTPRRRPPT